jgi:hypothetical protein
MLLCRARTGLSRRFQIRSDHVVGLAEQATGRALGNRKQQIGPRSVLARNHFCNRRTSSGRKTCVSWRCCLHGAYQIVGLHYEFQRDGKHDVDFDMVKKRF